MFSLNLQLRLVASLSLAALLVGGGPCLGGECVAELIRQLAASHPHATRLDAMKRLGEAAKNPATLGAIPALVTCLKDQNPEIRSRAIYSLAEIGIEQKQTCPPIEVFALLSDPNENVRNSAWHFTAWPDLPEEAFGVVVKFASDADPNRRSDVATALGNFGRLRERAIPEVMKLIEDKHCRNNAVMALWKLTGDVERVVPYWVEALEGWKYQKDGTDEALEKVDPEETHAALSAMGAAYKLTELGKTHPERLSRVLISLLKSESSLRRRLAARSIGALWIQSAGARPFLSQLEYREKLKEMMLDDPDEAVWREAGFAILRIDKKATEEAQQAAVTARSSDVESQPVTIKGKSNRPFKHFLRRFKQS